MSTRNSHSGPALVSARGESSRKSSKTPGLDKSPKGEALARSEASKSLVASRTLLPTQIRRQWREKFLSSYPRGFYDSRNVDRSLRWAGHELWDQSLNRREFYRQIRREDWGEIVRRALEAEAAARLLSPQERQSLREALKPSANARLMAKSVFDLLHGPGRIPAKFALYTQAIAPIFAKLPRNHQWPAATLFPFLANPDEHVLVHPTTMQSAAASYAFSLSFEPSPNWQTYARLLAFADIIKSDLSDLRPRDMIDVQFFMSILADGE